MYTSGTKRTIEYNPGNGVKNIAPSHLRNIRSRVTTHEGQTLHGARGEKYIDKYSSSYLKKDLSNCYRSEKI